MKVEQDKGISSFIHAHFLCEANYLHFLFIYHTDVFLQTCTAMLAPYYYVTIVSIISHHYSVILHFFSIFTEVVDVSVFPHFSLHVLYHFCLANINSPHSTFEHDCLANRAELII